MVPRGSLNFLPSQCREASALAPVRVVQVLDRARGILVDVSQLGMRARGLKTGGISAKNKIPDRKFLLSLSVRFPEKFINSLPVKLEDD